MKKGQSTLEYLITYGWAILIIVVIAAILWYFGVFNPSRWAGKQATGFSRFVVDDFVVNTSGGLTLVLGSKEDKRIQNVNVTVLFGNGTVRDWDNVSSMGPGSAYTFHIDNATDPGSVGDSYRLSVRILYTKGSLSHSDEGTLIGTMEST